MDAWTITDKALTRSELPTPELGPGDVLIKVAAAGLNRADVAQIAGLYPPPPGASEVPGLEVSGTIERLGSEVRGLEIGENVVALLAGGGYAQYVAVPAPQVLPAPSSLSLTDAAGLPETLATVYSNIFMTAGAKPGDTVLVHGGAGGIGTAAIQMCTALGLKVIATAGSREKCELCLSLGAIAAIDYRTEDFVEAALRLTDGHGVNVVLDVIGAKYLERNIEVLAFGGRVVVIGLQGGASAQINLSTLMGKRAGVLGTTLRSRPVEEKGEVMAQLREHVWPLVESGQLRPLVDKAFPLAQAPEAIEYFNSGKHTGKVLLLA